MRGIKLSNVIILVSGIALCVLGVVLLIVDGTRERGPVEGSPQAELPKNKAEFLAAGEVLAKQHNCNFCHRTEAPKDHPPDRANCQQCHQLRSRPENLAPPLKHIAERRPEEWIRRYLRYPYAIRGNSNDRMPDLSLSDFEIEVLTGYLVALADDRINELPAFKPQREKEPDASRLEGAAMLWDQYQCGTCHSLGAHTLTPRYQANGLPVVQAQVFAPRLDTAFARTRPEWLAAAIADPAKWLPWAGMTAPGISQDEANELAWYVINAVPSPKTNVTHDEVMSILMSRCNGCHYAPQETAPEATNPAGGAGWLDTWSAKARKLDLVTYAGLRRGAVDDLGRPRPSVVPYAENSPLLAHLEGRKQPHMPFGANPLPAAEIAKIREWIMAGAPGPEVKGGIQVNPPIEMGD
ncbi:MAG: c-type cytochrome [Planctomycetes bacterium]|nr:c-type cytochrome [Planctomycetota bacterium]